MPYLLSNATAIQLIKSIINDPRTLDLEKSMRIQGVLDAHVHPNTTLIVQGQGSYDSPLRMTIQFGLPLTFAVMYFSAGKSRQFMHGRHQLNHSLLEITELTSKHSAFCQNEVGVGHGPDGILTAENIDSEMACCWHTWFAEELEIEREDERTTALINMFSRDGFKVSLSDPQPLSYTRDKTTGQLKCRPLKM